LCNLPAYCLNLRHKCPIFGQICTKRANFTPDLGNTGRSSKHIPFFRFRALSVFLCDCGWSSNGKSIVALFLSYKQRPSCAREDTLPNGISWAAPAVNHCFAHGTWNHASDRCCKAHHCSDGLLPLRCRSTEECKHRCVKTSSFPLCPGQEPGPLLVRHSNTERWSNR